MEEDTIEVTEVENDQAPEVEETESENSHEEEAAQEVDETSDEEAEENSDESDDDEKLKGKKKNGFAKRIDKFKSKLSAKDQEIEYWRQEAIKNANQSKGKEEEPVQKVTDNDAPNADDFESFEDYLDARAEYLVDQKLKARSEAKNKEVQQSKEQERAQQWRGKVEAFSEQTPDFEEVMEEAEDLQISEAAKEALFYSESGVELMYLLAKNPNELERINSLPPALAAMELGKIEAGLAKKENKVTNKTTKAPAPLRTVRGGAKVKKDLSDPNLSQKEYEELRAQQLKKRA